jgi:hypothetical protein
MSPSTLLYRLRCIVGLAEGVLQLGIKAKVLGSIPIGYAIFAALIPPSLAKSPYGGALPSTHMTRTCDRSSHAVGEMLG